MHASWAGDFFFFLDPRIHRSSKIRTDPRRIRIDPGFGGFVLPLAKGIQWHSWVWTEGVSKAVVSVGHLLAQRTSHPRGVQGHAPPENFANFCTEMAFLTTFQQQTTHECHSVLWTFI